MSRARILADYVSGGTTAAEFDYLDGVTSNLQTQLDAKSPTTGHASIATVGTVTSGTWEGTDVGVAHGGTGASTLTANYVLLKLVVVVALQRLRELGHPQITVLLKLGLLLQIVVLM